MPDAGGGRSQPAGRGHGRGAELSGRGWPWPEAVRQAVTALAAELGPAVQRDHPLGALTTYRVGGPAALFHEASDREGLSRVGAAATAAGLATLVLGKGSNLLVADAGFPGLVVALGEEFAGLEIQDGVVRAGGALALPVLARRTAAAGLHGLEWCVGVPGSVGGGVRMNAGGHGSDMAHCVAGWELVDLAGGPGGDRVLADLDYRYRHSSVGPTQVVVAARFHLVRGDPARSEAEISEIVRWRREHQPGGQNAGSVFTNPEDDSAGRLIEAAGLKGRRWGTAVVSEKHANFIQADPDGSADDVMALMEIVRSEVQTRTGVLLRTEVRLIGFAGHETGGDPAGSGGVGG